MNPETAALKLLDYCRANDWAGFDPYDALNSRLFEKFPFLDAKLPRLVLTQALKRSPVNLRPLLLIPKTQNPKGLALFISSLVKLSRAGVFDEPELIRALADKLAGLRSPHSAWCWGYSFAWQTRTIVVPRGTPNAVCTIFAADALLDLYEWSGESRYLEMAASSADYLRELIWTEGKAVSLSYPLTGLRSEIHNANLLGAALLCRVYKHTGDKALLGPAMKLARYSALKQRDDGSWPYGETATQQWIDNFHTGYNLCALRTIGECADTSEFETHVQIGHRFYVRHFFREDGAPRYFHDRTYPIDGHCVAQSILTLLRFQELDGGNVKLAERVFEWSMGRMWDERGFFYYRVLPFGRIKTSYMRWVQAWMLLSLSTLVEQAEAKTVSPDAVVAGAI
jgi:hypothetical protein